MDVVSWIGLSAIALGAVAIATTWLLTGRDYGNHAHWFSFARGTLSGLLLACFMLLGVEVFTTDGAKEVVFDGWIDGVVDSIDGTSDRDERLARNREGSGRGSLMA